MVNTRDAVDRTVVVCRMALKEHTYIYSFNIVSFMTLIILLQ